MENSKNSMPRKFTTCITTLLMLIEAISVMLVFLARVSHRLVAEDACFSMRITLGFVLIRSLVCTKCVPGHLPRGSGMALNKRAHEKVVKTC